MSAPAQELELKLNAAPIDASEIADRHLESHAWRDARPKPRDNESHALLHEGGTARKAEAVHLAPTLSCEDAFRIIGRNCLSQLVANRPAMLTGDADGLHQMRVALRRLRSAISVFAGIVVDAECGRIKAELRWISHELGRLRDLDVVLATIVASRRHDIPDRPGLGALARAVEARRTNELNTAVRAVCSHRFRTLVQDVEQWIEAGPWSRCNNDPLRLRRARPVAALAAEELAQRRRQIKRKGMALRGLSSTELHKLRIKGKILRYASEFLGDAFPGENQAKLRCAATSALRDFQSALGGLNDIAAREKLLVEVGGGDVFFDIGRADRERLLGAAERAYRRFVKVEAFWTKMPEISSS
jgi:CHAD domain-containing protein